MFTRLAIQMYKEPEIPDREGFKQIPSVQCPFDPAHIMEPKKLLTHINRCKSPNKKLYSQCKYDPCHWVYTQQLKKHEKECVSKLWYMDHSDGDMDWDEAEEKRIEERLKQKSKRSRRKQKKKKNESKEQQTPQTQVGESSLRELKNEELGTNVYEHIQLAKYHPKQTTYPNPHHNQMPPYCYPQQQWQPTMTMQPYVPQHFQYPQQQIANQNMNGMYVPSNFPVPHTARDRQKCGNSQPYQQFFSRGLDFEQQTANPQQSYQTPQQTYGASFHANRHQLQDLNESLIRPKPTHSEIEPSDIELLKELSTKSSGTKVLLNRARDSQRHRL